MTNLIGRVEPLRTTRTTYLPSPRRTIVSPSHLLTLTRQLAQMASLATPCADQLAVVFSGIFNLALALAVNTTFFKDVHYHPCAQERELNDYRAIALTSVIMKCFERLVKDRITFSLPDTFNTLQFA